MRSHFSILILAILTCTALGAQNFDTPPPREIQLVEKKAEQLTAQDNSPLGLKALALAPAKWKHAETDHFIVHYRRVTEAQRVVREIEYTLWFAAQSLGATKERYARKSHVYVFQDMKEWVDFRAGAGVPKWSSSFAHGDNLFLHIGGAGERFDSETLAHETTHAVVARLYPRRQWPIWLNEGFAEYMSTASLAARKGLWTQGMQRGLSKASMPLAQLVAMTEYPATGAAATESEHNAVHIFYQSSQKLVRFLMNNFPKERFPRFIDVILAGANFENAIVQVYGDQVKNYADFTKKYDQFIK